MLQRTAMPNSSAPSVSVNLTGPIRNALHNSPLGVVVRVLSMPLDRTAFVWWLAILALFGAGAGVHVWLSVQIAQAQTQLTDLKAEHTRIELDNAELMWQISQYTSLPQVQSRATSMGFRMDFSNQYMPVAADLPPVVITTQPMVQALTTANPSPASGPTPSNVEAARDADSAASRMNFGRLGISVPRTDWVEDLRVRADTIFTDLNLGLDLLWTDLRAYGERTWPRMAGDPNTPKTILAATR